MASKVCVCGQWCIALQLCSFPPGESTTALIKATTESPRELPANYITGSHDKDPMGIAASLSNVPFWRSNRGLTAH